MESNMFYLYDLWSLCSCGAERVREDGEWAYPTAPSFCSQKCEQEAAKEEARITSSDEAYDRWQDEE